MHILAFTFDNFNHFLDAHMHLRTPIVLHEYNPEYTVDVYRVISPAVREAAKKHYQAWGPPELEGMELATGMDSQPHPHWQGSIVGDELMVCGDGWVGCMVCWWGVGLLQWCILCWNGVVCVCIYIYIHIYVHTHPLTTLSSCIHTRLTICTITPHNPPHPPPPPPPQASNVHPNSILSHISIALLEDSGWYTVNTTMAQPLLWGAAQGPSFVTTPCYTWAPGQPYNCRGGASMGCAPGQRAMGTCDGGVGGQGQSGLSAGSGAHACWFYTPVAGGDCMV